MRNVSFIIFLIFLLLVVGKVSSSANRCGDSDGKNQYEKGVVKFFSNSTSPTSTYVDICTSSKTVKEYYCGDDSPHSELKECTYGCKDGRCCRDSKCTVF